jgi:antirestriction protein
MSAAPGSAGAPSLPDRPRIYAACLAAYNNGCLHGRWIDAATPDEIRTQVPAVHNHEGFEGAHLSDYASVETLSGIADHIGEHGELKARLYAHFSNGFQETRAAFEDYGGA